jgi:hypothetical protein
MLLELTYWTPLVVLLLSSLGLIALKRISRLPPWAERLAAPPFYFVSLPVATLIAWIEMLAWIVLWVCTEVHAGRQDNWLEAIWVLLVVVCFYIFLEACNMHLFGAAVDAISFMVFCAAPFVSGRMLWRTLRHDEERKHPSNRAKQLLRILLLLFVFAWAFLNVRTYVLFIAGDHYLRIVCVTSCNATMRIDCRGWQLAVERL